MDPISAVALATKAVAEMITEIVKGQPPDVKAQMWAWYIEDVKWWRNLLHP